MKTPLSAKTNEINLFAGNSINKSVGAKILPDLISIIVPCFNVERFLDDCFASLENQTYKNFEVIFINDGSTDGTLAKLEKFCNSHSNCKLINQKNQGVSAARNNGIAVAQGEFVCFLDADDLLSPHYLFLLHSNIKKHNSDWSICGFKWTKEKFSYKKVDKTLKAKNVKPECFNNKVDILNQLLCSKKFYYGPVNKLFRMSIFQSMEQFPNIFDTKIAYGEDADLNFRYATQINSAVYSKQKLYYYRQRKGSAVKSKFSEKHLTVFRGWQKSLQTCQKSFPEVEKYVRACMCISSLEMLFRIFSCDYENPEIVNKLYACFKQNRKFLWKAKKFQLYKRICIPIIPPLIKIMLCKKLKHKDEI